MTIGVIDHDCCWCGAHFTYIHTAETLTIQHGENPEAVLRFPQTRLDDMADGTVTDEAFAWLHAIHAYETPRGRGAE